MKGNLLIVDDEKEIRDMLSRHFRLLGYDVLTAEHGLDALSILQKKRVDVVISDIIMPEMDGVDLLREIRKQYPMVRIIMITGYVTLENALACMRNQADTCIFKPLNDLGELEEAVQIAIAAQTRWTRKFRELKGMKPDTHGGQS
ncbi:response regulator receiver domain-containing protein [Desulfobotulus alkaliphilus]|uniref:Response regulator receiver domain-containing protein n=1 Tax=Desulfobotulus alkaliphilus TaxID=622671 RepID=A0A562S0V9_9BACT|nr:response regulator [Desulfobotulus alkaliphilus]TWI74210.1 response regulator receiver domain-containing protein [Desulfobotulus alkaliphilus]